MIAQYYILFFALLLVVVCSPVHENQRAVSLVYKDNNGNFKSNLNEVAQILLDPKIKDLKVAVVSIAGKYRRGKSFLLNFFLRYLNSKDIGNEGDWLGSENAELKGFEWKTQAERVTTGILIWSKIFVTEMNNEKIAIVLMDTQGTFDDEHVMMDHTKIFAMVTLLSSFEIYNVMRDIEEDDLQVLAMFTQYAEQVHNKSDVKMGQNLQFLVRDWSYPYQFSYGTAGGKLNLEKKLSTANRKPEFVRVREALQSSYDHISCYLMPHPGLEIISNPNSKGQVSVMDKTFVEYLREYVPFVFSKENLSVKTFNRRPITVADLVHYIKFYEKILTTKSKHQSFNIFEIHVHATFDLAKKEASKMYNDNITSVYRRCNSLSDLNDFHMIYFETAMKHFNETNIKGVEDIKTMYATKLEQDITSRYLSLKSDLLDLLAEKKRREKEEKERKEIKERIEKELKRMEEERKKIEDERRRLGEQRTDFDRKVSLLKSLFLRTVATVVGGIVGGPAGMVVGNVIGSTADELLPPNNKQILIY